MTPQSYGRSTVGCELIGTRGDLQILCLWINFFTVSFTMALVLFYEGWEMCSWFFVQITRFLKAIERFAIFVMSEESKLLLSLIS